MLYLRTITFKPNDMSVAQESLKRIKRIADKSSRTACMLINRVGIRDVVIGWLINQIGQDLSLTQEDPVLNSTVADIVNLRFKEALSSGFATPFVVDSFLLPVSSARTDGTHLIIDDRRIDINPHFNPEILDQHPRLRVMFTKQNHIVFSIEFTQQSEDNHRLPLVINPDYSTQMFDNFGNIYSNPENFTKTLQERTRLANSLANKHKGSLGHARTLEHISQLDSKLSNIAIDSWHKAAKTLVQLGRPIIVVQVNRKGISDLSLDKSVYASNGFIRVLQIKAQAAGVPFIAVPWANILAYMAKRENIIPTVASEYASKYPDALMSALVAYGLEWNVKK